MKKFLLLGIGVLALSAILLGIYYFVSGRKTPELPSCGKRNDFFSVSPLTTADLTGITPLGNLNPKGGHVFPTRHIYLRSGDANDQSKQSPLFSPGDVTITRIQTVEYITDNRTDYSLFFEPCQEVRFYFLHVTSLSQKLLDILNTATSSSTCNEYEIGGKKHRSCTKEIQVSLTAGEEIGTVGAVFDFGATDERTPALVFANPSRWYGDILHAACALDYFPPVIKTELEAKLSLIDVKRVVLPLCGEVAQDESGTAQGIWFVRGTTQTFPEDPHLALVHSNGDPTTAVFSIGTSLNQSGLAAGAYYFTPEEQGEINREFKNVTADGKIYCYEPAEMWGVPRISETTILLQLTSPTTLKIEGKNALSCTSGSWDFSSASVEFER